MEIDLNKEIAPKSNDGTDLLESNDDENSARALEINEKPVNIIGDDTKGELVLRKPYDLHKIFNGMRLPVNVDIDENQRIRMRREDECQVEGEKPWLLKIGSKKDGHTFRGIPSTNFSSENSWVFARGTDGIVDVVPMQEWYFFHPTSTLDAFSAEEAEEAFKSRDKVLNFCPSKHQDVSDDKLDDDKQGEQGEQVVTKRTTNARDLLKEASDSIADDLVQNKNVKRKKIKQRGLRL